MIKTDEFTTSACAAYADAHLTYNGCVRDNRDRADFYSHRWLVWMQRDAEFFRNSTEHVILKDQQGKIVDEYYVDDKMYKNFYTVLRTTPGAHLLSLQYVNDLAAKAGSSGKLEDRNLWIQRVELQDPGVSDNA